MQNPFARGDGAAKFWSSNFHQIDVLIKVYKPILRMGRCVYQNKKIIKYLILLFQFKVTIKQHIVLLSYFKILLVDGIK
jgi:hypothetical protein